MLITSFTEEVILEKAFVENLLSILNEGIDLWSGTVRERKANLQG